MFVGLMLSRTGTAAPDQDIQFGFPLVFHLGRYLTGALGKPLSPLSQLSLHPIAIAAWVGMFATSLNLLPGGQLDGGHLVFAFRPGAHKIVSRLAIAALIPLGMFYWIGWFVWALLLFLSGLRHPAVPLWPELSGSRRTLSLVAVLLLVLTMIPTPFHGASGRQAVQEFWGMIHR